MKHFKSSTEAEKGWLAVVYKMKEAEEQSRQKSDFEEKLEAIIKDNQVYLAVPKTHSPKRKVVKK